MLGRSPDKPSRWTRDEGLDRAGQDSSGQDRTWTEQGKGMVLGDKAGDMTENRTLNRTGDIRQDRRQMTALLARLVAMENKDRQTCNVPVRARQEDTLMPPQLQARRQTTAPYAHLVAMERKQRRLRGAPVPAQQEDTLMV